jgi:hypothetical protein
MITDKNKDEIIHKYFKGELDEQEKAAFAKKYQTDEAFREEVDEFKIISGTFKNLSRESADKIEEYLAQKAENDTHPAKTIHLRNYRKTFAIAASIAVLVALGIYFVVQKEEAEIAETEQTRVPVYASDTFGFTEKKGNLIDSIALQFHQNPELAGYYTFTDTLRLYYNKNKERYANVFIQRVDGNYYLVFEDDTRYEIQRGLTQPRKLQKTND